MSSDKDDNVAGPSGLARREIMSMLGLDLSDSEDDTHSCVGPLICTDSDEICQEALDQWEQSGGGLDPSEHVTFQFDLEPFVNRKSDRMGVQERHFKTQLRQRGNLLPGQNITQALQDGLRRAVDQVLTTTPDLHDQDRLYFTIASDRLHNNFQGWGLRAGEWRRDTERVEALFQRLAQALNSNEQFEMDDSFQVSITQVHHAPQGTGRPRRGKPGHPTMTLLTTNKRSVIRIQNDDELCCARALVVAKARVDQHPKLASIRRATARCREPSLGTSRMKPRYPSVLAAMTP